jgi:hypothetical protein
VQMLKYVWNVVAGSMGRRRKAPMRPRRTRRG